MRAIAVTAAITTCLHVMTCGGLARLGVRPTPAQAEVGGESAGQGVTPETTAYLKNLLFADEPLDKLLEKIKSDSPGTKLDPWSIFASAQSHIKEGKTEEAKKDLRRILALPDGETRVLLSAWTALRGLGERPAAAEADKVQGIVFELHNEVGVGTIAAYADGRARWLGAKGKLIFWEAPGSDKKIDSLIEDMMKGAEPLVKRSPARDKHESKDVPLNYVRISVLTFGGIHITEVFGPAIEEERERFALPVFVASVNLLNALSKKEDAEQ